MESVLAAFPRSISSDGFSAYWDLAVRDVVAFPVTCTKSLFFDLSEVWWFVFFLTMLWARVLV